MQKDPAYLTDNKIRIFNGDREIPPSQVNWHRTRRPATASAGSGRRPELDGLRADQHPNPHGVYMHDPPAKGIFGDDFRFVSSGCVRVQNVRE